MIITFLIIIKVIMKFSIFNVITEIDENKYILSNTMTGSMYKIDASVRERVESNDLDSFKPEELERYRKSGIVVNSDVDEYQSFMYFSSKSQFCSTILNITLFLTNNCNLRCTYCFQSHDREDNVMSEGILEKVFEYIKNTFESNKNLNALSFVMFGGEPCQSTNFFLILLGSIVNKMNMVILLK